jgi:hypothetical protein
LALIDEAVELAEPTDYLEMRAASRELRGSLLAELGRRDESRNELERALELYERKGVVPSAARVRGRLAEGPAEP